MTTNTIALIGLGNVGATTAYTLLLSNLAHTLLFVDCNTQLCKGHQMDLLDTQAFGHPTRIQTVSAKEARAADIIIISAGHAQKVGESRQELLARNKAVMEDLFAQLRPLASHTIIIMVTNPVDVLTLYAQELSGLPREQVFGSSTLLDTIRLKRLLGQELHSAPESVDALIIGEHGDSQVVVWSACSLTGKPVSEYGITPQKQQELAQRTRQEAYEIIAQKGATYYGVARCITELVEAIVYDRKKVLPVSWYAKEYGLCLGMPCVIGKTGVERRIELALTPEEQKALDASAAVLKKAL